MELEPGVSEALDKAFALGKQDGNEHLLVVRDGKEIACLDGDEGQITVDDAEAKGVFKPGDILIHNHPSSLNSLSNMDTLTAAKLKARWIYAITDDKSIYRSRLRVEDVQKDEMFNMLSSFIPNYVVHEAAYIFQVGYDELERTMPAIKQFEDRISLAHWMNLKARAFGMIDYDYDMQPETSELVDRINRLNVLNPLHMSFINNERNYHAS